MPVKARTTLEKSDARLWALLTEVMYHHGVDDAAVPAAASDAVAQVRRHRDKVDTWTATGDRPPYEVMWVYDLNGQTWMRMGGKDNADTRDTWRMVTYREGYHDPACAGVWMTPHLLSEFGPVSKILK